MTKSEIAKHIFARNPQVKKLFITSDGQAFYEEQKAEGHSQRLKDRTVTPISRTVSEAFEEAKANIQAKKTAKKESEPTKVASTGSNESAAKKETTESTSSASGDKKKGEDSQGSDSNVKTFPFLEENVGPASEKISKVESVEELDAIAEAEKAGEDRKGVHAAIEGRRAELTESKTQKSE